MSFKRPQAQDIVSISCACNGGRLWLTSKVAQQLLVNTVMVGGVIEVPEPLAPT